MVLKTGTQFDQLTKVQLSSSCFGGSNLKMMVSTQTIQTFSLQTTQEKKNWTKDKLRDSFESHYS